MPSQVRVRPLLAREKLEQASSCVTSLSDKQIILGSDRAFTFDRACVHAHCVTAAIPS
jgi:hypothetical protein